MTVAEFIEWLKTQDQDAVVDVLHHTSGSGYYDQGGNVSIEEFTATEFKDWEYTDFRGNQYVKEDAPHFNKRFLQIGTKDN